MAWITASLDTGFYVGNTINLTTESSATSVLWKWKSLLKTAGWYVAASWNGSSGAKGEDILTSSVTNIPLNSWFVISQPSSSRSYHVAKGSSLETYRVKYSSTGFDLTGSVTAQYPGPLVTGSSAMRRISDGSVMRIDGEIVILSNGLDSSPNFVNNPFGTIASGTHVVHIAAQNTDPYMFYAVNYHSASTAAQPRLYPSGVFWLDCMEPSSRVTGFDPYITYFRIPGGGYFPMIARALLNGGPGDGTSGFSSMLNQTASFSQNTYGPFSYSNLAGNPGNIGTNGIGYQIPGGIDQSSYAISGVNLNPYNGKIELFPAIAATEGRWASNLSCPRDSGYKGVSSLFMWKGTNKPSSDVALQHGYSLTGYTLSVSSSSSLDWLVLSDSVFPWFGITPSGTTENASAMLGISASLLYATSSNWFSGTMLYGVDDSAFMTTTVVGSTGSILYRGRVGANYVYNVGTPPAGAVDVVIVKIGN